MLECFRAKLIKHMTNILAFLASIAGIAMCLANYPQVYKIYRTKSSKDISVLTYLILVSGSIIWLFYGISIKNFPLIITHSFGTFSALLVLIGLFRYRK
jgi:MtN3 and saliva related transmembrane protein